MEEFIDDFCKTLAKMILIEESENKENGKEN